MIHEDEMSAPAIIEGVMMLLPGKTTTDPQHVRCDHHNGCSTALGIEKRREGTSYEAVLIITI